MEDLHESVSRAQGGEIWNVVENDPYVPKTVTNNVEQETLKGSWNEYENKKVLFDKKANNILQSTLAMDELFCISHCKTTT